VLLLLISISVLGRLCLLGIKKTLTFIRLITCILVVLSKLSITFRCWYGIPGDQDKAFDKMAAGLFPEAKKECSEFLRHKTYLINPLIVKQKGITVHKCVQYPGEFVITFCGSYHAGFNMGYNCAEAVNFALKRWIDIGKKAGVCKCHNDSVKIDMQSFLNNLESNEPTTTNKPKKKVAAKEVDNWLKCDACSKWRKIPKSIFYHKIS
jgi:hypothetical protein